MFNFAFSSTLPLQGSLNARSWDDLYWFLFWLSVFFFVLVVGGMIYFAIVYRKKENVKPKYITGNHFLETIFIVIPTILLMVIFGWGFVVYQHLTQAPTDAYEIHVIARQWAWTFQYPDGRTSGAELYVPLDKPVKLIMTSQDVIHSFFVPNFRIKQDVVPGMYTSVWFQAKVPGKHHIFCAEYCGTSHSGMLGHVVVLNDKQWSEWNRGKDFDDLPDASDEDHVGSSQATIEKPAPTRTLADQGRKIFQNNGCLSCHSTDGSRKVGPSLKGVFGSHVELSDGSKVDADENYIRESIENPTAKIVKGFSPVMPTFKGVINETQMNALIAYIKSLK